jgi:hypothetical protein
MDFSQDPMKETGGFCCEGNPAYLLEKCTVFPDILELGEQGW